MVGAMFTMILRRVTNWQAFSNVRSALVSFFLTVGLTACQSASLVNPAPSNPVTQRAMTAAGSLQATDPGFDPVRKSDQYLCVVEPTANNRSTLKVMNLQTRWVRRIDLVGRVLTMTGDRANGKLYLSVRSGTSQPYYEMFVLDLKSFQLDRSLSFSQARLVPIDVKVRNREAFVSAKEGGIGGLLRNELDTGAWEYIASHFPAGLLEWGDRPHLIQSVYFGDDNIERTTIDIASQQVVDRQQFPHGVPFGNNVGLLAPQGNFFYAFHQLQGEVSLYAFDINQAAVNRQVALQKAVGILYSTVISKDGTRLYASIDNRIERFALQGSFMRKMPAIQLRAAEARHLSLSEDQRTLYVSHEDTEQISRVYEVGSENGYRVDEIPFAGKNEELIVF